MIIWKDCKLGGLWILCLRHINKIPWFSNLMLSLKSVKFQFTYKKQELSNLKFVKGRDKGA